jgi:hypothetical protein
VDDAVVQKAKELGLNLSEITESVLRGFTFTPSDFAKSAVRRKYQELFDMMLPLLKKYKAEVVVVSKQSLYPGFEPDVQQEVDYIGQIILRHDGTLWDSHHQHEVSLEKTEPEYLLEPQQILKNFITAIATADKLSERIEELEMAKRIVEAISGTFTPKSAAKDKVAT